MSLILTDQESDCCLEETCPWKAPFGNQYLETTASPCDMLPQNDSSVTLSSTYFQSLNKKFSNTYENLFF